MKVKSFEATSFARDLTAHMCAWRRGVDGSGSPMLATWEAGIFSDYRDLARLVAAQDEIRLHPYAAALTSSQMFALNLFLPFREGPREALAEELVPIVGSPMRIERLVFEWIPPGAILGELAGDRPADDDEHATAVDVVAWGTGSDGIEVAVLLEVKLGEGGFTTCNGRTSRANRRPDVCASARTFLAESDACYLQSPAHKLRDRRYWTIFSRARGSISAAFPGADLNGACPFAGNAQQPMRNLAIARGLEQEGVVGRAFFGLCAHDANPDVSAHWIAWHHPLARVVKTMRDNRLRRYLQITQRCE